MATKGKAKRSHAKKVPAPKQAPPLLADMEPFAPSSPDKNMASCCTQPPPLPARQQLARELDNKLNEVRYLKDDIERDTDRLSRAKVYLAQLEGEVKILRYKVAE